MKKWLFILVICFLFMPKDVFASSTQTLFNFTSTDIASGNTWYFNRSVGNVTLFGIEFMETQFTDPLGQVRYVFNDTDEVKDMSFFIYQSNVPNGAQEPPVVLANYQSCNVQSFGYYNAGYTASSNSAITFPGGSSTDPFMWYRYDPISSGQLGIWFNGNKTINYNTQFEIKRDVANTAAYHVSCSNVDLDQTNNTIRVYTATSAGVNDAYRYAISRHYWSSKSVEQETNEKLDDLNESITDSDISGASDSAGGFFTDFENDDYGLSDIVTLPLTFIQGLANASCTDLELPLPFVDEDVELPCMSAIYEDYFGPFLTIYQIITFGIVGYWVCVNTLRLVNNFKNPDNDEVEVMDL